MSIPSSSLPELASITMSSSDCQGLRLSTNDTKGGSWLKKMTNHVDKSDIYQRQLMLKSNKIQGYIQLFECFSSCIFLPWLYAQINRTGFKLIMK